MGYADYNYYVNDYTGCMVPEEDFLRIARRAAAELDKITFGRIDGAQPVRREVRDAFCAVCEALWQWGGNTLTEQPVVQSEKLDAYSVAYQDREPESLEHRIQKAAALYLWGTGLLSCCVPYRSRCV